MCAGARDAPQVGTRNAECGARSAECGTGSAEWLMVDSPFGSVPGRGLTVGGLRLGMNPFSLTARNEA